MDTSHQEKIGLNPLRGFFSPYRRNIHPNVRYATLWSRMFTTFLVLSISVARYHGTTAAPRYHFYTVPYSTVAFTVLFSTAIPQVPRFFDTVLVRCWHTITKTALYFDWNCNLQLVFCHSPLNFTRFTYVLYVVLFYCIYQMSENTSLRQRLAFSVNYL